MDFEKERKFIGITGEKIGYLTMFIVFTLILYFMLRFFKKIPTSWNYLHVIVIGIIIILISYIIKRIIRSN